MIFIKMIGHCKFLMNLISSILLHQDQAIPCQIILVSGFPLCKGRRRERIGKKGEMFLSGHQNCDLVPYLVWNDSLG